MMAVHERGAADRAFSSGTSTGAARLCQTLGGPFNYCRGTKHLAHSSTTDSNRFYAVHSPNPCNQHSVAGRRNPYPFMWYYRTELRNDTESALRVVWFEGFGKWFSDWEPQNIMGRPLTQEDFAAWYTDENGEWNDGIIPAGRVAVCATNWHGSWLPWDSGTKWAYKAIDESGREWYAEAEVESKVIVNLKSVSAALILLAVIASPFYYFFF